MVAKIFIINGTKNINQNSTKRVEWHGTSALYMSFRTMNIKIIKFHKTRRQIKSSKTSIITQLLKYTYTLYTIYVILMLLIFQINRRY